MTDVFKNCTEKFKVTIVVVNWNSGELLKDCVRSVGEIGGDLVHKIIVVDNNSTDGSADFLKSFCNVRLVLLGENLGFGKACNLGAQYAESDYLLFLNPDAALHSTTLRKAVDYMQDPLNAKVAICGVQLLDEFGHVARSCARFPSPIGFLAHAIGLDRFFPRLGHVMAEWDHDKNREVDQVIGAFFLVRRSTFESLSGFDERFFVYFEEVDFSYRARQIGCASTYLADVQAFHAGGGTSNQVRARRLFYSLRSRLLYAFKHFSWLGAAAVLLATLFVEPLSRSALALLRRSWSGFKETWAAYRMLWRWMPQWIFKGITR